MNTKKVDKIKEEMGAFGVEETLRWLAKTFGGKRVALASSLGAEDQILTQMISDLDCGIGVFTLDTGRLHQETYDLMQRTRDAYLFTYDVLFPERKGVEEMESLYGPNLFYSSIEKRKKCCEVRKMEPLRRKLETLDVWICGLRREQSVTRTALEKVEWDEQNGLLKVNPLVDWTQEQIWAYIRKKDIPYNILHDKGFPSIGCACCTRAVQAGEDARAGRWWWELPEQKECGLHRK